MSQVLNRLREKVNWRYGLKTALAAGICLVLARLLKLQQGYWACISSIVVMQSETAATLAASRDRLIGTALGAVLGWVAATVWHGHLWVYAVTVLLCMLLPQAIGLEGAGRLAGVTTTIILLVPSSAPHALVARDRFLEVSFGIIVSLVVAHVLWPQTTLKRDRPDV